MVPASHKRQFSTASISLLLLALLAAPLGAQESTYRMTEGWAQLPEGFVWGQIAAVDLDSAGNLYVFQRCGANTCIGSSDAPLLKFSPDGQLLWSWGSGMIVWPHGLEIDREDKIWLTDGQHHEGMGQQVLKLDPAGEVLLRIGTAGVSGEGQYTFNGVADVVIAGNGDIFVADGHVNNRVVKYSADGTYLSEWGRKGTAIGEFNMPHAIEMDSQGRVIVSDRDNYRLQVFAQDGTFLHEWRQYGRASGLEIADDDTLYTASQNTDVNPTMVRGLYIGNAADGNIREIIPGFNSEAVVGAADGTIYSGQRPLAGTPAASDPDILQRFVRE